jgi:hypothetical protein
MKTISEHCKGLINEPINEKTLPILMQKFPVLAEIGLISYKRNPPEGFAPCKTIEDYFYILLGHLAKESIISHKYDFSPILDQKTFFKLLEDYMYHFLDLPELKSLIYGNRKNKKELIKERYPHLIYLLEIFKKYNKNITIWDIFKIKQHDSSIKMQKVSYFIHMTNQIKRRY